jgi:Spy/CpxP family protein refolding chaperone
VNSWKVILATLVIFGAGVVTGGLLVSYAVHVNAGPRPPVRQQQFPGQVLTPWQARSRELVRRMQTELDLTSEQRAHIEKIIADSQERTKVLWKPIVPQMSREMQHVHAQIRDELNPDQQKKFDELIRPRQMRKGDDSSGPSRSGGQRRMTNIPSVEGMPTNAEPVAH